MNYFLILDDQDIDLLQKFLQLKLDKRISAEEALKLPFFDDFDDLMTNLIKIYILNIIVKIFII